MLRRVLLLAVCYSLLGCAEQEREMIARPAAASTTEESPESFYVVSPLASETERVWEPSMAVLQESAEQEQLAALEEELARSPTLDRAIKQITSSDTKPSHEADAVPKTLEEARAAVAKIAGHPITAARDYRGWYLFGTVPGDNDSVKYHNGYAIRQGDTRIYYFGFW